MAASGVDVVTLRGIEGHPNVETTMICISWGVNVTKVANPAPPDSQKTWACSQQLENLIID
jgi:hypothetical protein